MQDSKLGYRTWAFAFYMLTTSPKSVSSLKLANDLGITQKTAWFLAQRIRKGAETPSWKATGPVELDEAFIGGPQRYMHMDRRFQHGRGPHSKLAIVGARDRATGKVQVRVISRLDGFTIKDFVDEHAASGAVIYHDQDSVCRYVDHWHESVNHTKGEYVRGFVSTNSIESFWAIVKRSYRSVHHFWSFKHVHRYITALEWRFNHRELNTLDRMRLMVHQSEGKVLTYTALTSDTNHEWQPPMIGVPRKRRRR